MATANYRKIVNQGLWTNNPALVQILGLCPLLAVSSTVVNALGMGLATTLTLVSSNLTVSLIRHQIRPEIRIPVFVLIIAAIVTAIELLMHAFFHELYLVLGLFIPLIVTNCVIIARAEAFASKNSPGISILDGLMMGLGFTAVLIVLGSLREVIGQGTLFANAHIMFGEVGRSMTITVIEDYRGFLLAILPPGAFILLGFIIATKNVIDAKRQRVATALAVAAPAKA